jgi:hypothetical protein
MFIGHFAVGLAGKRLAPRVSLGLLFVAAQLADLLWPALVLAGVEVVRVDPGNTVVTPLDFVSYPWSHSLTMLALWGALLGGGYLVARHDRRGGWVLGAVVVSHWVLDWASHRPDMPLLPTAGPHLGLELWQSRPATMAVELLMFAAGLWLYLRATRARDRAGKVGVGILVAVLLAIYAGAMFGPPPPSEAAVAISAFGVWIFVALAWWADRHRAPSA